MIQTRVDQFNIVRELKYVRFLYSDEGKEFIVQTLERKLSDTSMNSYPVVTGEISFNKTYAFSLVRFLTRIFQRNWLRRKK